jgi:hypothetical protein
MFDKSLSALTFSRISVEYTVAVNAILSVFKERMTKHVRCFIVTVIPNKRNGFAIITNERISSNGSAVRATNVIACSPTTKVVVFH